MTNKVRGKAQHSKQGIIKPNAIPQVFDRKCAGKLDISSELNCERPEIFVTINAIIQRIIRFINGQVLADVFTTYTRFLLNQTPARIPQADEINNAVMTG
jgi:hypothetical protein